MIFGALGDIHGDFAAVRAVLQRHPEVPFWLCVGDVGDDLGHYEAPPAPIYWIKGNNEDFDLVERAARGAHGLPNLIYVPNGRPVAAGPLTIAGIGGTFAPKWYDTAAAELPPGRKGQALGRSEAALKRGPTPVRDDKRRHFVREEVEVCKQMPDMDVFLSHEAARPFVVGGGAQRHDAGKTPINEILEAAKPRLHLFGHHHRYEERIRHGVPSICLELVSQSYLLIESDTMAVERLQTRGS